MRISFIGSGNVATHLAAAFKNSGHSIHQVWSRTEIHAAMLAYHVKAQPIADIRELDAGCDLVVIAVNDDAIGEVAAQLAGSDRLLVHTSGSTPMHILDGVSPRIGVFYPLQTFSRHASVDMWSVPIAIEANSADQAALLLDLGRTISNRVLPMDSEQRISLHIAAVFASNFANHLWALAQQLLQGQGIDFDLLRPLIEGTAAKVMDHLPADVQTGPAVRNDQSIVNRHLAALEARPELREIYRAFSQSIINLHLQGKG